MSYRYETHLHTCLASACGRSTGREHVRYYKEIGYTGIFVTDHFYRGNTAVDRSLPWDEWVRQYCRGWEDAADEGAKVGLDVFFGWEESIEGDDYLIYGLDGDWLIKHPEARTWTRQEQYETVRADGGCVVQAHPFRTRDYIHQIHLSPRFVDAVEIANAGNDCFNDVYAYRYAQEHGFLMTVGSDNHFSQLGVPPEGRIYGIETARRIESAQDYANMIRAGEQPGLIFPAERIDPANAKPLPLKTVEVGERDKKTEVKLDWFGFGE